MSVRLDRLLSNLGYCSRKEVGKLVKLGALTNLEGKTFKKASDKVEADQVLLEGEPLDPADMVLLMHKPSGYTCSHRDRPPLIFELLPDRYFHRDPQLSCVGRLDKDTTGLLLFTDKGKLLHRLISPNWKVDKYYQVTTTHPVNEKQVQRLAQGGWCLPDDDKPLAPAKCRITGERSLELILTEGRFHQVKRMLDAVDNPVMKLHRSQFGDWTLDSLKSGEWRHLNADELKKLSQSCGLTT